MRMALHNKNADGDRFTSPLYSPTEAASIAGITLDKFRRWAFQHQMITLAEPQVAPEIIVPFAGLAETLVLSALRQHESLQKIRRALVRLRRLYPELRSYLASQRLYASGRDLLFDLSVPDPDLSDLVSIPRVQGVMPATVADYLHPMTMDFDKNEGYAERLRLSEYRVAEVVVDHRRAAGRPIFARGGVRVAHVLDSYIAGHTAEECCEEYSVPVEHIEDAVRVHLRKAA